MNSKGQTSIEVIILVVVIIGLATFVVSRYTLQQNNIFVTAAARQAFLGEVDINDEIKGNMYLDKVSIVECGTIDELRVALFVNPDPGNLLRNKLQDNIKAKIEQTLNTDSEIKVSINPGFAGNPEDLTFLIC